MNNLKEKAKKNINEAFYTLFEVFSYILCKMHFDNILKLPSNVSDTLSICKVKLVTVYLIERNKFIFNNVELLKIVNYHTTNFITTINSVFKHTEFVQTCYKSF